MNLIPSVFQRGFKIPLALEISLKKDEVKANAIGPPSIAHHNFMAFTSMDAMIGVQSYL